MCQYIDEIASLADRVRRWCGDTVDVWQSNISKVMCVTSRLFTFKLSCHWFELFNHKIRLYCVFAKKNVGKTKEKYVHVISRRSTRHWKCLSRDSIACAAWISPFEEWQTKRWLYNANHQTAQWFGHWRNDISWFFQGYSIALSYARNWNTRYRLQKEMLECDLWQCSSVQRQGLIIWFIFFLLLSFHACCMMSWIVWLLWKFPFIFFSTDCAWRELRHGSIIDVQCDCRCKACVCDWYIKHCATDSTYCRRQWFNAQNHCDQRKSVRHHVACRESWHHCIVIFWVRKLTDR